MYKIYHTEGIVLASRPRGEADKFLLVFTRDLGMIWAQAQGIRKLSSKLKPHLQDFCYCRIDLVRGKEIWRVTNAEKISSFENIIRDPERFRILCNVSRLLERLVGTEEQNKPLHSNVVEAFSFLNNKILNRDEVKNSELIIVLRILYYLGYIGDVQNIKEFTTWQFTKTLLKKTQPTRKTLLREVNHALRETQL